MKKYLLTVLISLTALASYAQTENPHMTFKGVPIDGTRSQFVQKMKQKGFSIIDSSDNITLLSGSFAGYTNCDMAVLALSNMDLVCAVGVFFPECDTWSALYGNYASLKKMLTQKYGEPSDVAEKFDGYSEPNDDMSRMLKVKMDRCKYYSIFETSKGDIELLIDHDDHTSCFVSLTYRDRLNILKEQSQAIDDL